jgi:kynurenine formamidase
VQAVFEKSGKRWVANLNVFWDLSVSTGPQGDNPSAFYIAEAVFDPIRVGGFVGSVAEGGSANCEVLTLCAHGNGTHTECVGHISKEFVTINTHLKRFLFVAELITILPFETPEGDFVITRKQLEVLLPKGTRTEAVIMRTLGNSPMKLHVNYSNTNPPYLLEEAIAYLNELQVEHLLIDLPSVDKEQDGGKLAAHHAFWQYPHNTQKNKTITELIYVPNEVDDGTYLLNLQIAPFENDASPSKPIIYKVF